MSTTHAHVTWVVLTRGDRERDLCAALRSVLDGSGAPGGPTVDVLVVSNGAGPLDLAELDESERARVRVLELTENLGVPGGRHAGALESQGAIIGFLDDDAVASPGISAATAAAFDRDPWLGAVSFRLIDEQERTARRHVPRFGRQGDTRDGEVALFLGGASAIRGAAYRDTGGYFTELFYGHEELELCWRLIDRGWSIRYLADVTVFHPHTEISRHPQGWSLTGRNRVLVALRTLPWPIAIVHVTAWLLLGSVRAPGREARRNYVRGWMSGWTLPVERRPIRWATVGRLVRLGRPPIL